MTAPQLLILDFGSQYTQLIARRVRELNVYCEIHPFNQLPDYWREVKGIILSGSPCSVRQEGAPDILPEVLEGKVPVLGVCYGAQLIAKKLGGTVAPSEHREYGRAKLHLAATSPLFEGLAMPTQVWMSHSDTITALPENIERLAGTESIANGAYALKDRPVYGIQFHPEVTHTTEGLQLLRNFVIGICGCEPNWTPASFVEETVAQLRQQLGSDKVVLGLSGGVDSSVAAMLLHQAIGQNLYCVFVDNGLLRKDEFDQVVASYQNLGLNLIAVDAKEEFYTALKGLSDPEAKRKAIGKTFIDVFQDEANLLPDIKWLGQGTIYPDVIESVSVNGPSVTIKSHHNVGGLPEKMKLKIVEPLRMLFKDEVRRVGKALGLPDFILNRHPFPGPGLAIRILGDITPDKVRILQDADAIYINHLRQSGWYDQIWQAGAILLNAHSVGVMGDERTYEQVVALRAVTSQDGMTADWVHIPYELLAQISNDIINRVKGVNRVVYDISSKPPATIEWE
ncbi:glutamine-hydrolyzing GMP synthase [Eisenibacter elegans]|jgi:GMP synthase (glutamine-hydrolysing)|uniref:glutamine-hydrolyzing GMP synthase n=1 Tax=Eisenibacter elegans TaxID=997 RepID=UPI0004047A0B|nr:glutamine-hydrolyzing GMP synthase [Eisenibacter elegans]